MPLLQRKIEPNIAFVDKALYEGTPADAILDNIGYAYKVGTAAQLAMLANMAHEIFSNLLAESTQLSARIQSIAAKTDYLCNAVYQEQTSESYSPPEVISLDKKMLSGHLLRKETIPSHLKLRYDNIQVMPALQEMDKYMGKTQFQKIGPTALYYSDPSSFLKKWIADQEKKIGKSIDERVNKKAERKARMQQKVDSNPENSQYHREKKKGVNWRERYEAGNRAKSRQRRPSYIRARSNMKTSDISPTTYASNDSANNDAAVALLQEDDAARPAGRVKFSVADDVAIDPNEDLTRHGQGRRPESQFYQGSHRGYRPVSIAPMGMLSIDVPSPNPNEFGTIGTRNASGEFYPELSSQALHSKARTNKLAQRITSWGHLSMRIQHYYACSVDTDVTRRSMPFRVMRGMMDSDDDIEEEDEEDVNEESVDSSDEKESTQSSPKLKSLPPEFANEIAIASGAKPLPDPVASPAVIAPPLPPPPPPPPPKAAPQVHTSSAPPTPQSVKPPPPPNINNASHSNVVSPMPPPPPPPRPPPPPKPASGTPTDPVGLGRMNLLSSIATGKRLRPVAADADNAENNSSNNENDAPTSRDSLKEDKKPTSHPPTPKKSFLSDILSGSAQLKKTEIQAKLPPKPALAESSSINRILERRKHIQESDSETDSDEDDDDWA